jgi:hypothetical protein
MGDSGQKFSRQARDLAALLTKGLQALQLKRELRSPQS